MPREEEARIQNQLTRMLSNSQMGVPHLRKKLIDRLQQDGVQSTATVDSLVVGATAVVGAIRSEEFEIAALQREHPNIHQFIGVNDTLDARRMVDLVSIRYESAEPQPVIHEVRLVQVQAGTVTPEERDGIIAAHRKYYGEIIPLATTEEHKLRNAVSRTVRGDLVLDGHRKEYEQEPSLPSRYLGSSHYCGCCFGRHFAVRLHRTNPMIHRSSAA